MEEKLNTVIDFLEDNDDKLLWIEHHSNFNYTSLLEIANSILENRFSNKDVEIMLDYLDFVLYNRSKLGLDYDDVCMYRELISELENQF